MFPQGERTRYSAEPNMFGYNSLGIFTNALFTSRKVNPELIASIAADRP